MAKLVTVLCVVYCHSTVVQTPVSDVDAMMIMPAFFIIYGMALQERPVRDNRWGRFIASRIRSLLVPYVLWALFYCVGTWNSSVFWGNLLIGNNMSLAYAYTSQVIWFLPCMFVATLLFQVYSCLYLRFTRECWRNCFAVLAMIGCALVANYTGAYSTGGRVFGWDIAFCGCAFMIIGSRSAAAVESLRKLPAVLKLAVAVTAVVLAYYPFDKMNLEYCAEFGYASSPTMAWGFYGRIELFIISGCLGTIGVLAISMLLEKYVFLAWMGRFSLAIMAVHMLLFSAGVTAFCDACLAFENGPLLRPSMAVVIIFLLCIPLCVIINWACPELNGKAVPVPEELSVKQPRERVIASGMRALVGVIWIVLFFALVGLANYSVVKLFPGVV